MIFGIPPTLNAPSPLAKTTFQISPSTTALSSLAVKMHYSLVPLVLVISLASGANMYVFLLIGIKKVPCSLMDE